MRHAPCAMRHAPRAMRHAPCAMRFAPFTVCHALCAMRRAPCALSNAPCVNWRGRGWRGFRAFVVPCSGRSLGCIRVCTGDLKLDSVRYWVLFVKRFSRVARVCQFGLCAMYPSVLPYGSGCLVYVRVPVCMGRVVYSKPHAGRAPKSSHVFVVARTLMLHV